MVNQIVECIANYSEARNPEVIEQIKDVITAVPGVTLLDQHSDMDHNRTVLTFVGSIEAIEEATYQSIRRAAELIDLDEHRGEHPRIGATDVVPFVPISGVTMEDCIQIAHRVGMRVGDQLGIPVYLYEEAASHPNRRNLENIRRGEYERLKVEIGINPERDPDYGPKRVGKSGATVIGARQPLIAFNVYLTTSDVSTASKIARAVRHSTGGLRYVKALGMEVEGLAQVSMNLTNYRHTPIFRVVELIRREAQRYGVAIHHTELVGLIPQEALIDAAQWHMQMDQFDPQQILENRLRTIQEDNSPVKGKILGDDKFLDALADATPTPGGGSAAAFSGAAGAALVAMVARLTIGKKKYLEVESQMKELLQQAEAVRTYMTEAIQEDANAYAEVMNSFKMPKETEEQINERKEAIQTTTKQAARVPLDVAEKSVEVMSLALQAVNLGNLNAISDAATGAALARAALVGAGYNVRINVSALEDEETVQVFLSQLREYERRADELEMQISASIRERAGLFQS